MINSIIDITTWTFCTFCCWVYLLWMFYLYFRSDSWTTWVVQIRSLSQWLPIPWVLFIETAFPPFFWPVSCPHPRLVVVVDQVSILQNWLCILILHREIFSHSSLSKTLKSQLAFERLNLTPYYRVPSFKPPQLWIHFVLTTQLSVLFLYNTCYLVMFLAHTLNTACVFRCWFHHIILILLWVYRRENFLCHFSLYSGFLKNNFHSLKVGSYVLQFAFFFKFIPSYHMVFNKMGFAPSRWVSLIYLYLYCLIKEKFYAFRYTSWLYLLWSFSLNILLHYVQF